MFVSVRPASLRPSVRGPLALAALLVAHCGGTGAGTTDAGTAPGDDASVQQPAPDLATAIPPSPDLGPELGDSITLTLETFEVPAGGEVYRCQNFANPFGEDVDVQAWESNMSPGSHHLLVFYKEDLQNKALETCSGLEFDASPYGAQTPNERIVYPAGVGMRLPKNQGVRIAMHYLNASASAIQAKVTLTIHKSKPGTVTQRAGVFFFNNVLVFIPPGDQKLTKTCTLKSDMTVLYMTGHMHKFAKNMSATLDGAPVFNLDSWSDAPFQRQEPAQQWKAGQKIVFTCTYLNTTGGILTFGESANTNEMCIFEGQYYPATDTTLACN